MHLQYSTLLVLYIFSHVPGSTLEDILAAARSQPESAAVAEGVEDVDSEDDSDSSSEEKAAGPPPPPGSEPPLLQNQEAATRSLSPSVPDPSQPADVGDDSSSSDAEEGDSADSGDGFTFVKEVRLQQLISM